jgi:hypothetical protein
MQKHNFNITFPIGDWLFSTLARPAHEVPGADGVRVSREEDSPAAIAPAGQA